MVARTNSAEGGSDGTVVTGANSGGASGDAWNTVTGGGGSLEYESTSALKGTLSYKYVCAASASRWSAWTGLNVTQWRQSIYFRFAGTVPTDAAEHRIVDIGTAALAHSHLRAAVNGTSKLVIKTNNATSTLKTYAYTLLADTIYRLDLVITVGTSNCTIKADLYLGDDLTPVETGYTTTTGNSGSASNIQDIRYGKSGANAWAGDMYLDDIRGDDTSTSYLPPSNIAPVADAGDDQEVDSYTTISLNATLSYDTDGTIASYAWTLTSGSPSVTIDNDDQDIASVSFGGYVTDTEYVFQVLVTDDDGAIDTASCTVTVRRATEFAIISGALVPTRNQLVSST